MTPEDRAKIAKALDLMAAALPDNERIGRAYSEAKALLASSSDDGDWRTVADALEGAIERGCYESTRGRDDMRAALAIAWRHINKEGDGAAQATRSESEELAGEKQGPSSRATEEIPGQEPRVFPGAVEGLERSEQARSQAGAGLRPISGGSPREVRYPDHAIVERHINKEGGVK